MNLITQRATSPRFFNKRRFGLESLESRLVLSTLFVTAGGDAGAGTLRDALEQASTDATVNAISIKQDVGTIELDDSLVYSGEQALSIKGGGAVIQPLAGQEGDFDLLVASGGADLAIRDLVFANGSDGIFVELPADAVGTLKVSLNRVTLRDNAEFGLHIDDQSPSDDPLDTTGSDSDAGIVLDLRHSVVTGNGTGELDRDGVRVDDGGAGGITARVVHTHIDSNGGDGLELDERGDGDVHLTVRHSTFDGNGFYNTADLDDGLDVDEADGGSLWASLVDASLSGNYDQGLDLDEGNDGSFFLSLRHIHANDNIKEGVKANEDGDGSLIASLIAVESNGSQTEEGVVLGEEDAGNLAALLVGVTANGNQKEGVDISEDGDGNLAAALVRVTTEGNFDDGIHLEETGAGSLAATAVRVRSTGNTGAGIKAEQETVGGDTGKLRVRNSVLTPNGGDPLDLDDVNLT